MGFSTVSNPSIVRKYHMILIIDFGSQYNQLIARRVRESKVFCQIESPTITINAIRKLKPEGIILSGGLSSIYDKKPKISAEIFKLGIPVLGICYGMHFMMDTLGGRVEKTPKREYEFAELKIEQAGKLFKKIPKKTTIWMGHGDTTKKFPTGFRLTASTDNAKFTAVENEKNQLYGIQFHPEVIHTAAGKNILDNFLFNICKCSPSWKTTNFIAESIQQIQEQVGSKKVILGLSGGVDSSVVAALLHKAIGKQLTCIFVDHGLLRKDEDKQVRAVFKDHFKMDVHFVKAQKLFLSRLAGVTNPEQKRKIIGKTFIDIFEVEAKKIKDVQFLAQGTVYPDIIESQSAFGDPSAPIKSHHNVGGLPKRMKLELVEPLKLLFKDEVREVGTQLGLPYDMIWRQPFPGPGLAVRIVGKVTAKYLSILRKADAIIQEEIRAANLYDQLWQTFAIFLPIKSVGIMGDLRTYEYVIALRAVTSQDAMTADWAKLDHTLLGTISNRIINEVKCVNRVVYDISSKPPSTIEWE